MKKLLAVVLLILVSLSAVAPVALAAEEADFQLTIDVNERYTDISETVEGEDIFGYREKESKAKETKRATFIAVLSVALVAAVVVLVITLRKVPKEDEIVISSEGRKKE